MTIKVTVPNTSSDSLTFGSANTPTAAQVVGIDSGSSNGQLAFNTTASGTSTERVRIDSAGNVGVGTSSPAYKLDAQTTATGTAAGDNTAGFFGSQASGRDVNIRFGDSVNASARIGYLSGSLYFYTNGAERLRVDTAGNLLVGASSGGTGRICSLIGASSTNAFDAAFSTAAGNAVGYQSRYTNTTGTAWHSVFVYNGNTVGSIQSSSTTTSYVTSSDYRLKEAIAPMTGALAKVALLKPVTYKWKVDGSDGQGFIAHELQEVIEGCVTGKKDAVDAEGNPQYQGIDTSFLVATLTAAIQELKAELDALKAQVEAK